MNRALIAIALLIVFVGGVSPSVFSAEPSTRPPNIVFILADDLGYAELGCFGQTKIKTPNIDRLAAEGMKLTQHYAGNAVCAPSRCVLMTGMHPGHATIRNNREHKPEGQQPMHAADVTLAELLKTRGYTTGAFGKWGLGFPGSEGDALNQGFDHFYGYNCQRHAHSIYPAYLWDDDQRVTLNNNPPVPGHAKFPKDADPNDPAAYARFKGTDYAPDRINTAALDFIRRNKDNPFYCYYPTVIPHLALQVPDDELAPYLGKWPETPAIKAAYTPHQTPRAAYAAFISHLDANVGRVLDLLDTLGLTDNTIVVFTSDNGATYLREVDYEFFQSVGPLRGLKGSLYEGGVRVPAIVRWPGHVKPGSSSDFVSGFEDWLPTLAQIVGIKTPDNVDGISLVPTLTGKSQPARDFLYREFSGYGGQQSVRVGDWKAIRQQLRKGKVVTELYNLADDIAEQHDLAADHPDRVKTLEAIMRREHTASQLFPLQTIDP
ncbi:arylsulfatase [Planctomycetales bacterium ZRK34]|nr:arylsulfatase [Planctomycetales bacterium ZRK34]